MNGGSQLVVGIIEDDVVALGAPKVTEPPLMELDLSRSCWFYQYRDLIGDMREGLAGGYERYGTPVLRNPKQVPIDQRFLRAKLTSCNKIAVTLAIDVTTADVVGYKARSTYYYSKDTLHLPFFFPFKDTTAEVELGFNTTTYTGLEEAAAAKRGDIKLSRPSLSDAIESLDASNSTSARPEIARALIVVMQMVCEAARFRSFERRLNTISDGSSSFIPNAAMIGLEDNWIRLSTAIQQSYQRAFNNPFPIKRGNGELFYVDSVSDILKANLVFLKFSCLPSPSESLSSCTTSNPLRQVITASDDDTNIYGGEDLCPEFEPTSRIVGRDGLCIVVQDSDPTDGNKIILDDCRINHVWTFKRDGTIRWRDKCLTAIKNYTNRQAPQQQSSSNNNNDQLTIKMITVIYNCSLEEYSITNQWNVTTDGSINIFGLNDYLSLTAAAGQGTTLTLEDTTLNSSQAWLPTNHYQPFRAALSDIRSAGFLRLKEGGGRVLVIERLRNGGKITREWGIYADGTIRPVSALHQCLTLTLGKVEIENRVVIEDCSGSYQQRWMFRSNGYLMNPASGLILSVRKDGSVSTPIARKPLGKLKDRYWLPWL
ncbi:hypothetical protein Tsubulata_028468 [Turnera subulata]|uniref:Ribosome-inactivating protein n=1 Tax=Turnera subulata TaxID=218843 RepID=A0A9Q0J9M6_9ROSI|nr:hypothetical protein Tsubulata_028468 [Turnera subulata]